MLSPSSINKILIGVISSAIIGAGGMLIHHNSKISSQDTEIKNLRDVITSQTATTAKLQEQISQVEVKIAEQKLRIDYIPENSAKYKKNYSVSGSKLTIDLREFKENK